MTEPGAAPTENTSPDGVEGVELAVHPLELFFDLVFVFALTQVAFILREDTTAAGLGRGALILTMVYWGWSLYTWGVNATGTRQVWVRLSLLQLLRPDGCRL